MVFVQPLNFVIAPVCEIALLSLISQLPQTTKLFPYTTLFRSVKATLFAPVFVKDTAAVKRLFCPRVIANAQVVTLEVPGTVKTPAGVIAHPALIIKF